MTPKLKLNPVAVDGKRITKTTDFLLPLLGKSKSEMMRYVFNSYLNVPELNIEWKNHIFVLVRFSSNLSFPVFVKWLENHRQYRGSYDLFKGEFTMYIMEIPENFHNDYQLFLEGKYSHMSEDAKKAILLGRPANSIMKDILYRGKDLRASLENTLEAEIPEGLELWSRWDATPEQEMFNKEEFFETYFEMDPIAKHRSTTQFEAYKDLEKEEELPSNTQYNLNE